MRRWEVRCVMEVVHPRCGPDYYTRHDPTKTKARAVKQLEALGYNVTLQPAVQAG
jgi:hypothetical protein